MKNRMQSFSPALFSFILLLCLWLAPSQSISQVQVNINLQPAWGPADYDYVEYYYLPEYEVYYNVPRRRFVYLDGGHWVFATALPPRYGVIDYYSTYKVVINEPRPYRAFHTHRVQYVKYKHGYQQVVIRDSRSPRYIGHPAVSGGGRNAAPRYNQPQSRPGGQAPQARPKGGGHGHGGRKH